MKRGILLIATGHPYWGKYAQNLAISIKFTSPQIPICLAYTKDALGHFGGQVPPAFNDSVEIPQEYVLSNGLPAEIKAKTGMYKLSPYAETIYLDCDMIWATKKPITELFELLKDVDMTMANIGSYDLAVNKTSIWVDLDLVKEAYKVTKGKYYQLSSEFVYFKKEKKVAKFFKDAMTIFDNPKVKYTMFNGSVPDELPFALSMLKNDMKPHEEGFLPIYWEKHMNKRLGTAEVQNGYYAYSMGGIFANTMKKVYDTFLKFYLSKYPIQNPLLWIEKTSWQPKRSHR